jgi:hypothetical protein
MRVDAEEKKKVFLRSRGVGNISFGNSSSKWFLILNACHRLGRGGDSRELVICENGDEKLGIRTAANCFAFYKCAHCEICWRSRGVIYNMRRWWRVKKSSRG